MVPLPEGHRESVTFLPVVTRVADNGEPISFKDVIDRAARVTVRFGLFSSAGTSESHTIACAAWVTGDRVHKT